MSETKVIELHDIGDPQFVRVMVDGSIVFQLIIERTSPTSTNVDYDPNLPGFYKVQKFYDGRRQELLEHPNHLMIVSIDQDWTEPETDGISAAGHGYGQ